MIDSTPPCKVRTVVSSLQNRRDFLRKQRRARDEREASARRARSASGARGEER